jgi:hypothetical protein
MRECENILCGYLYDYDLVFVILEGICGFEFPERFSWRSLPEILLLLFFFSSSANLKTLLPTQPLELMPSLFAFTWFNAFQAVRHSHTGEVMELSSDVQQTTKSYFLSPTAHCCINWGEETACGRKNNGHMPEFANKSLEGF